jgi:HTH-like domain
VRISEAVYHCATADFCGPKRMTDVAPEMPSKIAPLIGPRETVGFQAKGRKETLMRKTRFSEAQISLTLRRHAFVVNHKPVHRIYRKLGLQLRPRRKRGVRYVRGNALPPVTRPNERWSIRLRSRLVEDSAA